MKLSSGRTRVLAAAVAGCGAIAAVLAAGSGSAAVASSAAAKPVVLVNCTGKALVRPASYILTCADANDSLAGVHWVSWAGVAFGSGKEVLNDCYPNCADGKFHSYPVLITLWRAEPRPGNSAQRYFSRLTVIRTGSRTVPHGRPLPLTQTYELLPDIG
jgi:hypothetical protein